MYLIYNRKFEARFKIISEKKIDFKLIKQFLKFGLPSGMQWALEGLAFTVFLIIMGRLKQGEAALSSSSIAVTVMMLSVLPSMGVAQAVMTVVGQCLGNKDPESARIVTWDGVKVTSIYMATVAVSFFIFPHFYLSWFENQSNATLWAEVTAIVPTLLKIVAMFTVLDSIYLNISFALKGAGDTKFVSLVALIVPWPLLVLPAYLVRDWENAVVWAWGFAVLYSITITGTLALRFKQGKWKSMSVIHPAIGS
jgi:multidrug resistance protein, MATE family